MFHYSKSSLAKSLIESLPEGIAFFDRNRKVSIANSMMMKLTGLPQEGFYIEELTKLFPRDTIDIESKLDETLATGQPRHKPEVKLVNFFYEIFINPVLDEQKNVIGGVIIFRDLTGEKELEKMRMDFLALASHQLRTPLSTVSWYTEMLLAGDAGRLNEEQKKYFHEVYLANQRMAALVNALLNVSRLESGTFVVEPELTDVIKLIENVTDEQKPQIDEKKLILSALFKKNTPLIQVDPKLLYMVVQNLLSNAIKYTPEGGSIKLSMSSVKGQLSIVIADTGYGIPKHQQDKIFSKFFRADNVREKDTDGTGLGLYIVKSIIDHSGGKIWFESEENKGTTFFVTLPLEGMKKKEGTRALA